MKFWQDFEENFSRIGSKLDSSVDALGFLKLYKKILAEPEGHVTKISIAGSVDKDEKFYIKALADLGGRLALKQMYQGMNSFLFLWEDSIIDLDHNLSGSISVTGLSNNEELILKIKKLCEDTFVTPSKKGYIFAIMRYGSSLSMQRIGFAGTPLEKDNYSSKIIEDYDYVIKDLKSPLPSGRIAIFDGPPGTGKTYMVRSILMDVPDALFVLVPPSMVSALGGPELLPMLLQHKESYQKHGPTVFILEDADSCLAPRAADNMDSVTSILNIGDGIFGSLFDIRIIATTNAKQADMDSAVIRAGRLSRRVAVNKLAYSDADRIFKRLLPGKDLPQPVQESRGLRAAQAVTDFSLAEVYKAARDAGWEPKVGEEPKPESELVDTSNEKYDDDDDYDSDDE